MQITSDLRRYTTRASHRWPATSFEDVEQVKQEIADLYQEFAALGSELRDIFAGSPAASARRSHIERQQRQVRTNILRLREELEACWEE